MIALARYLLPVSLPFFFCAPALAQQLPSGDFFAALEAGDGAAAVDLIEPQRGTCVEANGGADAVAETLADCWPLYLFSAQAHAMAGLAEDAETLADSAIVIAGANWPDDNFIMASSRNTKGLVLALAGRLEEAVVEYRAALRLAESALAPDDPDLADYLVALAGTLVDLRRYAEAAPFFERAVPLAGDPVTRGIIRRSLGQALGPMLKLEESCDQLAQAVEELAAELGSDHETVWETRMMLAGMLWNAKRTDEALALLEPGIAYWRARPARVDQLGTALYFQGAVLAQIGRKEEARTALNESLAIQTELYGADSPVVEAVVASLDELDGKTEDAVALAKVESLPDAFWNARSSGDTATAMALLEQSRDACLERLGGRGADPAQLVACTEMLTMSAVDNGQFGRFDIAEQDGRLAVAVAESGLAEDDENRALAYVGLASMLGSAGRFAEGIPVLRKALASYRLIYLPTSAELATPLGRLAEYLGEVGELDEALSTSEQALALARDLDDRLPLLRVHARILTAAGQPAQAEAVLRKALADAAKLEKPDRLVILATRGELARILNRIGRNDEALAELDGVPEAMQAMIGEVPAVSSLYEVEGLILYTLGRAREAERRFRTVLTIRLSNPATDPALLALAYNNLALALLDQGDGAGAGSMIRAAIETLPRVERISPENLSLMMTNLARFAELSGDSETAVELNRIALEQVRKVYGARHPLYAQLRGNLGQALIAADQREAGNAELEAAYGLAGDIGAAAGTTRAGSAFSRAVSAETGEPIAIARDWYRRSDEAMARAYRDGHQIRIAQIYAWGRFELVKAGQPRASRTLLRRAANQVIERIGDYVDFDAAAQTEINGYRDLFLKQVRANWEVDNG